jgi:hypothetical protein
MGYQQNRRVALSRQIDMSIYFLIGILKMEEYPKIVQLMGHFETDGFSSTSIIRTPICIFFGLNHPILQIIHFEPHHAMPNAATESL